MGKNNYLDLNNWKNMAEYMFFKNIVIFCTILEKPNLK